jgi:glycosyltransferase involved in cell wall biosynthesis
MLTQALFRLSLLGLKRMDRIVVGSQATAQSLIDLLGVTGERITVTHLGVDRQLFRPVSAAFQTIECDYGIPEEAGVFRILHVGSEAPRKNLSTLLEALALLRQRGMATRLIRAGGPGHPRYRAHFLKQTARLDLDERLTVVGEVPDSDLPLLYSAADVFVLPSHVEGFGLPLLEAMACGVPVVCSDAGALPEVAGDAALLVRPDHARGLADAIATVLEDAGLRDRLVQRGLLRCRQFTWAQTADQTAGVYERLMEPGEVPTTW